MNRRRLKKRAMGRKCAVEAADWIGSLFGVFSQGSGMGKEVKQLRSTIRPFTKEEMTYLREGVATYGRQWKLIGQSYPFNDRTDW